MVINDEQLEILWSPRLLFSIDSFLVTCRSSFSRDSGDIFSIENYQDYRRKKLVTPSGGSRSAKCRKSAIDRAIIHAERVTHPREVRPRAMEIVARRDAFRSGFEVILFAPGCAKKEDSNDGGGRIHSEKKRSAFFTLRNSPRDARVIRTRKDIFNSLFPPSLKKGSSFPKSRRKRTRMQLRTFVFGHLYRRPSKVSLRILFERIGRHCSVKRVISFPLIPIIIQTGA